MMLGIVFLFGMANFAAHKAMLESRHPLLHELPVALLANGGRLSLLVEFGVLLAAMALAANEWPAAPWIYGFYTAINCIGAWLLLTRRS
jgi:hypothetical protein